MSDARKLAEFLRGIMAFIKMVHMETGRLIKKYESKKGDSRDH